MVVMGMGVVWVEMAGRLLLSVAGRGGEAPVEVRRSRQLQIAHASGQHTRHEQGNSLAREGGRGEDRRTQLAQTTHSQQARRGRKKDSAEGRDGGKRRLGLS